MPVAETMLNVSPSGSLLPPASKLSLLPVFPFDRSAGEVMTATGGAYSVFTPYKNNWLKKLDPFYLKPYPVEKFSASLSAPRSGFLPSRYQGVRFRSGDNPVLHLGNPAGITFSLNGRPLGRLAEGKKPLRNRVLTRSSVEQR